ncbi:MAG: sigma-70 family RNA polymerase sigma factor [Candidatus Sulfotelmatobacter sp.]
MKESDRRRTLPSVLVEESAITIPDELERTFRAHHRLVFRTAYRITGNAADAEDVLQTVFLRLARRGANADAIKGTVENQESYLRRAAINAALDVMRWRQAKPTVELPDLPDELVAHDAGDLTPELRQVLGRAVAQLKPRSAEIFTLRFLEGFSNPQIAQMLGISQVLVAVIVHRTRQQLRKELLPYFRSYSGLTNG